MKRWNKKGQFFLIAAVVTIMILFTVTAEYNTVRQMVELQDFAELASGYDTESPKVINSAIFGGGVPAEDLAIFTEKYVNYARQTDPEYGLFYAYQDEEGRVIINNYLNDKTIVLEGIDANNQPIDIQLFSSNSPAPGNVNLDLGGTSLGSTVGGKITDYGPLAEASLDGIDLLVITVDGVAIPLLPDDLDRSGYTATQQSTSCAASNDPLECEIRVSVR